MNKTSLITYDDQLTELPVSKAKQIKDTFDPMVKMLEGFEKQYNEVMSIKEITPEVCAQARRLRIDIAKVRIETGKKKDKAKEYLKIEDRAIMGVHNLLVYAVKEKEDKLKLREEHFEILEKQHIDKLQTDRAKELLPYHPDAEKMNLGTMEDDVWQAYLSMKIHEHEDKIIAEQRAEQKRRDDAKKTELKRVRDLEMAKYDEYLDPKSQVRTINTGELSSAEFDELLNAVKTLKSTAIAKREKENLRKERKQALAPYIYFMDKSDLDPGLHQDPTSVVDHYCGNQDIAELTDSQFAHTLNQFKGMKEAYLQRKKAEADKAEALRKETEKKLADEKAERERLAAELKAKQNAEAKAELDRIDKEKAEKAKAEKLAKEPVKLQLMAWLDEIKLPKSTIRHPMQEEISKKFASFKRWAEGEINNI